jgi:cytochrome c-type protein NapB
MLEERFRKYVRIGVASALMLATVFVVGFSIRSSQSQAIVTEALEQDRPELPYEAGVFRRFDRPLDYSTAPQEKNAKRTLAVYYSRRAYSGAPPVIPHKVLDATSFGGKACNQCHLDGGWSAEFQAYAPVTPHPEYASCRQCHVESDGKSSFRGTTFAGLKPPPVPKGALPDSPPPIPHTLEMRSNCVSCHAGPAAVAELRTDHPERANCRQCHASGDSAVAEFRRPGVGVAQ